VTQRQQYQPKPQRRTPVEPLYTFRYDQWTLRIYRKHVELEMPRYYFSAVYSALSAVQVQKGANTKLTLNTGGLEATYYGPDAKQAYDAILWAINSN
jgi:hypothetical protein